MRRHYFAREHKFKKIYKLRLSSSSVDLIGFKESLAKLRQWSIVGNAGLLALL